jgi:PadR family transcriptional regulator, regulatory protein PadR
MMRLCAQVVTLRVIPSGRRGIKDRYDANLLLFSNRRYGTIYGYPIGNSKTTKRDRRTMGEKKDVWQGTLALMVLKTLDTLGPLHGYGIARRIEQTSGDLLAVNYGTLYPALLKLEQEGYISSEWGLSDNNRKAKYYKLTRAGRKQLEREARDWEQTTAILARFLVRGEERS